VNLFAIFYKKSISCKCNTAVRNLRPSILKFAVVHM